MAAAVSTSAPLHTSSTAVAEAPPARNRGRAPSTSGVGPEVEAQSRPVRDAPPLGLVESETSGQDSWEVWRRMGVRRRLGRMRRVVMGAAEIIRELSPAPAYWCAFITLTYRPEVGYRARHVAEFMRWCRRSLPRDVQLRYVWVLELTKSGKPHYHVAVWLPVGVMLPKPDQVGGWPHGSSRIERARAPVGYLVKYASKGTETDAIPRGARLCGCGGLERPGRVTLRWKLLPRYVRLQCDPGEHVVRFKGSTAGGWVSLTTGEWFAAPTPRIVDGAIVWQPPTAEPSHR